MVSMLVIIIDGLITPLPPLKSGVRDFCQDVVACC